jgi:hypothetical protein
MKMQNVLALELPNETLKNTSPALLIAAIKLILD